MAQVIGELVAVDGGELEHDDLIFVHPHTGAAVEGKPFRDGGMWHITIRFFESGRLGIPALTGRDMIVTDKPVIKVVYDDALVKAAGLELLD